MLVIPKPELMVIRLSDGLIHDIAGRYSCFSVEEVNAFFKCHAKDDTHAMMIISYIGYLRGIFMRTHSLREWEVQYAFYTQRRSRLVMKIYTLFREEALNEVVWVFDMCN